MASLSWIPHVSAGSSQFHTLSSRPLLRGASSCTIFAIEKCAHEECFCVCVVKDGGVALDTISVRYHAGSVQFDLVIAAIVLSLELVY